MVASSSLLLQAQIGTATQGELQPPCSRVTFNSHRADVEVVALASQLLAD